MSNEQFGLCYGLTMAGQSPTKVISGLTVSRLVSLYAPSTNLGSIFVGDKNVTLSTGSLPGFQLEAGKFPVVVDTNNRNDNWFCIASAPGSTITYITRDMA